MSDDPRSWDPVPEPQNWVRAILSDPLYRAMIANPNEKIPFILVEAA